jgi:ribonuclease HII
MKNRLCGIDEAGRGCLAGPMVVAGVVLERPVPGLDDSKKLTPAKRESLYETIIQSARYHICIIPPEAIDTCGISPVLKDSLLSIMTALEAEDFLFDGNSSYGIAGLNHLIKADAAVKEVSAASILAKVTKDRELLRLGSAYPDFDFGSHQGYGTAKHVAEIREFGLTPLHRKSYKIKSLRQPSFDF